MADVKALVFTTSGIKKELNSTDYLLIPDVSAHPTVAPSAGNIYLYSYGGKLWEMNSSGQYYPVSSQEIIDEQTSVLAGVVTLPNNYKSGSLKVYIDGARVSPSRITEDSATQYTISNPPDEFSTIVTDYLTYSTV